MSLGVRVRLSCTGARPSGAVWGSLGQFEWQFGWQFEAVLDSLSGSLRQFLRQFGQDRPQDSAAQAVLLIL